MLFAGRYLCHSDSTVSQEGSRVAPNSPPLRDGNSQGESNSPSSNSSNISSHAVNNSVSSQAGSQTGNILPQDSMTFQEASVVSPYNNSSRKGSTNSIISQEGNLGNTRSQAGKRLVSSQAVRCSTRLRASQASQADSTIPQVDSKVSPACSNSSQAVRSSTRLNASEASQADSAISQVDSGVSQAS